MSENIFFFYIIVLVFLSLVNMNKLDALGSYLSDAGVF